MNGRKFIYLFITVTVKIKIKRFDTCLMVQFLRKTQKVSMVFACNLQYKFCHVKFYRRPSVPFIETTRFKPLKIERKKINFAIPFIENFYEYS